MDKKVPEIRFEGFVDDWEQRKLGVLLEETKRPIKMEDDKEYQLVTVKRRNEGVILRGVFKGKDILVKNYFELQSGDYVISKRQVVHGANGIVPENLDGAIVSNEYLVSVGNQTITTSFLTIISKLPQMYEMFFLSSYGIDIEKLVFNVEDWKKRKLFIPSLAEQKMISLFFTSLDNTIALHQEKLEALREIKTAFLEKIFNQEIRFSGFEETWEQRKWIDTVDISTNMVDPKIGNYDELPHIGPGNIESFTGRLIDNVNTVKEDNLISSKFHFDKGDVIYGKINPQLGKYIFAPYEGLASADTYVLNGNNGLDQTFLFALLQTKHFFKYSLSVSMRSGIPKINRDELNVYSYMSPSNEEQELIGRFFMQFDDAISLHHQKIDSLHKLKCVYLQKMFL